MQSQTQLAHELALQIPAQTSSASGPQVFGPLQVEAPPSHAVPFGTPTFAGHVAALPLQVSAESHSPVDARHT